MELQTLETLLDGTGVKRISYLPPSHKDTQRLQKENFFGGILQKFSQVMILSRQRDYVVFTWYANDEEYIKILCELVNFLWLPSCTLSNTSL